MGRFQLSQIIQTLPVSGGGDVWLFDCGSVTTRWVEGGRSTQQRITNADDTIVSKGRFVAFDRAVDYLKQLSSRETPSFQLRSLLPTHRFARVVIPNAAFPADQAILRDIYRQAGWNAVEVHAAAETHLYRFGGQLPEASLCLVIDIGGDKTELSLITNTHVVVAQTWYQGGNDLTKALQRVVQRTHATALSWSAAETVKHHGAGLWPPALESKLQHKHHTVVGKALGTGAPSSIVLTGAELHLVYAPWYAELLEKVRAILQLPEVTTAQHSRELVVWLSGGGGQLLGLDTALETDLHTVVAWSGSGSMDSITGLRTHYAYKNQ